MPVSHRKQRFPSLEFERRHGLSGIASAYDFYTLSPADYERLETKLACCLDYVWMINHLENENSHIYSEDKAIFNSYTSLFERFKAVTPAASELPQPSHLFYYFGKELRKPYAEFIKPELREKLADLISDLREHGAENMIQTLNYKEDSECELIHVAHGIMSGFSVSDIQSCIDKNRAMKAGTYPRTEDIQCEEWSKIIKNKLGEFGWGPSPETLREIAKQKKIDLHIPIPVMTAEQLLGLKKGVRREIGNE